MAARQPVILCARFLLLLLGVQATQYRVQGNYLTTDAPSKVKSHEELPDNDQCFSWTEGGYSIAREDFEYPDAFTGEAKQARKGDVIPFHCESAICPNPPVLDCYMNDNVCSDDDSWCMLTDEKRFGPWAITETGETPNFANYNCEYLQQNGFIDLFEKICANKTDWGPWPAVRGRCVPYRKEQQSCKPYLGSVSGRPKCANPKSVHYVVDPKTGAPPARPLLCGPGLVCTADSEPIPNTCVKARPPNVCYTASWWDSSSWCRTDLSPDERAAGGLPREVLEDAVQALLIQLPVEIYEGPNNPRFWEDEEAQRSRDIISDAVQTLWPEGYRAKTKFPLSIPDPRKTGPLYSAKWNQTSEEAEKLYRQPNKLWSAVHTLIHNCRDPMPRAQVAASRSIAVWLRSHFMCCNCRGFWGNDVLDAIGLPPESTSREEHKLWWVNAHNMVSEHAAATRGGHPWIWPAYSDADFAKKYGGVSDRLRCQNPWFLPYEDAEKMWTIRE